MGVIARLRFGARVSARQPFYDLGGDVTIYAEFRDDLTNALTAVSGVAFVVTKADGTILSPAPTTITDAAGIYRCVVTPNQAGLWSVDVSSTTAGATNDRREFLMRADSIPPAVIGPTAVTTVNGLAGPTVTLDSDDIGAAARATPSAPAQTLNASSLRRYASTETPVVVIIGDSTSTELADSVHPIETLWGQITRALRRANPSKVHTFHNRGIGATNFNNINQTGDDIPATLPPWFTDTSQTWLSYVEALNPDVLFICSGINTSDAAQIQYIRTTLETLAGWARVPDIVFVTNKLLNPDATSGQVALRNDQVAQAAGVRHIVRSQAAGFGVQGLPRLGLLDFGRYFCQAFEGFDPCYQGLASLSQTFSGITTFPYELPECDGDFDVEISFPGQLSTDLLTGSNLLFISLADFFQGDTPWHRVRIGAGVGNNNTQIICENATVTGITAAAATPLTVRVLARDERIVVVVNGTTTYDGPVPRYQHVFRPQISFSSPPPNGTTMTVTAFRAGRRRLTSPFLMADQVWGLPGGDGNEINHPSSSGVAALDGVVLDAQDLAVSSTVNAVRHIRDFGVAADARTITGSTSITSGSTALTVIGASFTSADIGKLIIVPGAGAAGGVLVSTIVARSSNSALTLADAASTTITPSSRTVAYGTDDRAAVQVAINTGDFTLDFSDTTLLIGAPGLVVNDANAIAPATRVCRTWVGPTITAPMQGEGLTNWSVLGFRRQQARLMFVQASGTCIDVIGQGFSADGVWLDQNPADGSAGFKISRTDGFEDLDAYFRNCRFRNGLSAINPIGRGLEVKHCTFEGGNVPIDLDFPAAINSDTTFGQNPESAWRAIIIDSNRFHSIEQSCIRNTGAQAASIVGLQISNNHIDGGSVFRFFNGNVGRGTQFSANRITGLVAGGSGVVITGGESVTFDDCHFASHVDTSATETDWSNEAISFAGTVTGFVTLTNCTFRRFLLRAVNAANNMSEVTMSNVVFEDCTGTTNGTRSPIRFAGNVTGLKIHGLTHFQTTGSTYAADILTILGTVTRGFGSGWSFNPGRHRAHNNPAFALDQPDIVVSVSADYTTTPADGTIRVTDTSAARTITLSTTRLEPGHPFLIKDASGGAGTNNITVSAAANIDGAASRVISTNYGALRVRYTGTTFEVI
jgi:hypothetical protein